MIKIDKENYKIETDCKTVGEFMTEAAAIFDGNVTIIADDGRVQTLRHRPHPPRATDMAGSAP